MRASQKTTFDKNGFIKRIDLKIYPDDITVIPSRNGCLYLLDAVKSALCEDNERALLEQKEKNKPVKKTARK